MNLIEERLQWENEARLVPVPADVAITEETRAGVNCHWVKGRQAHNAPLILYVHGGGLVAGSAPTHRSLAATLTTNSKAPLLLVNYRLLPEHEFPAPLEDVMAVYQSLIDPPQYTARQIILGGDSSGAALVLSTMVELRERGMELPSKAFLFCGAFDATLSGESISLNDGKDALLNRRELEEWRDTYLSQPESSVLSPLFADLRDLPEIMLVVGGYDLWLSDSIRVAEKIRATGGRALLRTWDSMGHMWMMQPELVEAQECIREVVEFVAGLPHGNQQNAKPSQAYYR